jgi:hypothetical protein
MGDPNNVQTDVCRCFPLPVISSNEGNPCSGHRLKRHEKSHMDSVRFRLHNSDMTSTGVIAEDNKSCRRNKHTTRAEPFSLTHRFYQSACVEIGECHR